MHCWQTAAKRGYVEQRTSSKNAVWPWLERKNAGFDSFLWILWHKRFVECWNKLQKKYIEE